MERSSPCLLDSGGGIKTQVTIKLQPLKRKKKSNHKAFFFFPPKFVILRAVYQIPFLKRNSGESASSQKTSSARKVNNYKEGQHLSRAFLPGFLLPCWGFLENTLKSLRWSKEKNGQPKKCYHFKITCLFSPTKPEREDWKGENACLIN